MWLHQAAQIGLIDVQTSLLMLLIELKQVVSYLVYLSVIEALSGIIVSNEVTGFAIRIADTEDGLSGGNVFKQFSCHHALAAGIIIDQEQQNLSREHLSNRLTVAEEAFSLQYQVL